MRSLIVRDEPEMDHIFHVPREEGEGSIRGLQLEDGLFLRYAHFSYHENLELVRLPRRPESETGLSFCYLLPPATIKLLLPDRHSILPLSANHIFLASNNAKFSIHIPEETQTHSLMLLMTQEWLRQNLEGMEEKIRSIGQFLVL